MGTAKPQRSGTGDDAPPPFSDDDHLIDCGSPLPKTELRTTQASPRERRTGDTPIPGFRTPDEVMQRLYEHAALPVVPTGFALLDQLLGGGLRATQPYSLAAATGHGKTSFVIQIARHHTAHSNLRGGHALIWTLEMDDYQVQARMVSQGGEQSTLDVIHGKVARSEYMRHVAAFPRVRYYSGDKVKDFEQAVECVAREANGAPLLLIVDYLQKLARPGDRLREAVTAVSEMLRNLAKKYQAPILTVSAVGREAARRIREARDLHPGDLVDVCRESGAIEYDTAGLMVLGLDPKDADEKQTAVLSVAKNRFGQLGQIEFEFEGALGCFAEQGMVESAKRRKQRQLRSAIRKAVSSASDSLTKTAIYERVGRRKERVFHEIAAMVRDGELAQQGRGFVLGPNAGDDKPEACNASEGTP